MSRSSWQDYIPLSKLLDLQRRSIDRFGGMHGSARRDCPEATLANAWSATLYDSSKFPEYLKFAGYLLFYLNRAHCFLDGNKRIGWAAANYVVLTAGFRIETTDEDAISFCLAVAASQVSSGLNVVEWLAARVVAFP